MNVNLGAECEEIVARMVRRGYAASKAEAIGMALLYCDWGLKHDRKFEEAVLVKKAVAHEMKLIESGKVKTLSLEEVRRKFGK